MYGGFWPHDYKRSYNNLKMKKRNSKIYKKKSTGKGKNKTKRNKNRTRSRSRSSRKLFKF
tara:strand:- start:29012 stop:29191 length:180 start_codon:yes stop_codon:yes gene_type:complete